MASRVGYLTVKLCSPRDSLEEQIKGTPSLKCGLGTKPKTKTTTIMEEFATAWHGSMQMKWTSSSHKLTNRFDWEAQVSVMKLCQRIDTHLRHLRADQWCAWTHFLHIGTQSDAKLVFSRCIIHASSASICILEDMLPYKRLTLLYDTRLSTFTGRNYCSRFLTLSKIGWNSMDFAAACRHFFLHPASTPAHQPIPDLWE
jgi:hypothetical protein